MLSTIAFILETVPQYEKAPGWGSYFFYAECFFVVVFTIELSLKFWATPQTTLEFFKDALNVIDILAILPFYVELCLVVFVGGNVAVMDLRCLRALRLMRMMKMGRFSGDLQLMAEGLNRSRMSIALLCGTLLLGMVIFSVLMWIVERGDWNPSMQCFSRPDEVFFNGCSPYESVPVSFWWAITTMTTVGYGDAFPITTGGRFIGALAMLAGIFCVALPTGILCTEFSKLYEEHAKHCKETVCGTEHSLRPKAELELILDCEKLEVAQHELEQQLVYMKRLAYIYVDAGNKALHRQDTLKIDPMFTNFQHNAVNALGAMRNIATVVSAELGSKRTYARQLDRGLTPRYS